MPLWSSEIAYILASKIQSHRIWGPILALSLFIVQKKCRNYWNMYTRTTAFTLRIPQWGQSYRKLQIQRLSMWLFYPEGGLFPLLGGGSRGRQGEPSNHEAGLRPMRGRVSDCSMALTPSPPGGWNSWCKDCLPASSGANEGQLQHLCHVLCHSLAGTAAWMLYGCRSCGSWRLSTDHMACGRVH